MVAMRPRLLRWVPVIQCCAAGTVPRARIAVTRYSHGGVRRVSFVARPEPFVTVVMRWQLNNLTGSSKAPLAFSPPTGYGFDAQGTQHVIYQSLLPEAAQS